MSTEKNFDASKKFNVIGLKNYIHSFL